MKNRAIASLMIVGLALVVGSASADEGGGLYIFTDPGFQRDEAAAANMDNLDAESGLVSLLSIWDTLTGTAKTYTVPVDSTLTSVRFSASGTTSVALNRPDNSTVQPSDLGVRFLGVSTESVYSVTNPVPGNWTITVNGNGAFSLSVTGESALDLTSFRFTQVEGRPGHEGYFPVPGFAAGSTGDVGAIIDGAFNTAQFSFRAKDGSLLQTITLTQGTGEFANEFVGTISLPTRPFLAYVTGTDASETTYQRAFREIFQSKTVKITPPLDQELVPGLTNSYVFQVQNLGAPDTFAISDNKGFVKFINATSVTLATNQSANVTVQLRAPTTATPATSDTLTFTATGSGGSRATNFAVLTNVVGYPTTAPVITNISPPVGTTGTTVTIAGSGFRNTQGAGTVTFNSTPAGAASSWSATSITVQVPPGAAPGDVVVTIGGLASNGAPFSVIVPASCPVVTGLSPMSGDWGTLVTVAGTNFGSTLGSSALTFNGTVAKPKKWSDTSIVAPVPTGARSGEVFVKLGNPPTQCDPYGVVFTVQ